MPLCLCVVAVLLALPLIGATFIFPEEGLGPCGVGRQCVKSIDCLAYDGLPAVQRRKSNICGFSGFLPRVCCDIEPATPTPEDPLPPPSPRPSGEPNPTTHTESATPAPEDPLPPLSPRPSEEPTPITHTEPATPAPEDPPLPQPSQQIPGEPISAAHPALPTNCGKPSRVTLEPPYHELQFVLGGKDADISRWPWMVLFGRWRDGRLGDWFCGGTLITDRHVLTAAHCLRPEESGTIGARISDAKLSNRNTFRVQNRNVSRITRHPRYSGGRNDLAVVQLAEELELSRRTRPICLPPAGTEHVGEDVAVAGRGLLEFGGEPADRLQEAPLRVTDPAACEAAYSRVPQFGVRFPGGFQGTVVCAGSRDDLPRDACRGDSGGPLTIQLPASVASTYQLVGVVSQGFGCGNPEFPGLYTKVSSYIDWITQQLT